MEPPQITRQLVLAYLILAVVTYFSVWGIMYYEYPFVRKETHVYIERLKAKFSF